MPNEDPRPAGTAPEGTTPSEERESEDTSEELGELSVDESQKDVPVTREEYNRLVKGVKKLASVKGREKSQEKTTEATEKPKAPTETPTHSSDDVTELFLESKPEAEAVKDDLKTVADAKYGGSIIKAWKGEQWLRDKAQALSEASKAKSKISTPSNQIEGEIDFAQISKLGDAEQADAIKKMSEKDYRRWQEYQRKHSSTPGRITL